MKTVMEVQLSPAMLLSEVRQQVGFNVSRSTLYRWRVALNMPSPPYESGHVLALSHYGNYLRLGVSPSQAKRQTIQFIEDQGL